MFCFMFVFVAIPVHQRLLRARFYESLVSGYLAALPVGGRIIARILRTGFWGRVSVKEVVQKHSAGEHVRFMCVCLLVK